MSGGASQMNRESLRFTSLFGTGGIGTGVFFLLEGHHTLGRNESRAAELVPFKDYCKLHIISHYVAVLMDARRNDQFQVWPIGKVGGDEAGRALIREMQAAGLRTEFVHTVKDANTLFSVCFQYDDTTGGNITTSNSASDRVSPEDIKHVFQTRKDIDSKTLILAVPEVPMQTRIELLRSGKKEGAFNAVSLLASEVGLFEDLGGFSLADYVSVNIEEARAVAGLRDESSDSVEIARACARKIGFERDGILISITDGPNGSYGYDGTTLHYVPPIAVEAVGTGGAGDAFFAGVLVGLTWGLPFFKANQDVSLGETPLDSAMELGTLVASLSVTSPDTIHQTLDKDLLRQHAGQHGIRLTGRFQAALT
jgi:sugar/nucleoside kinase (ribokinase family)